MRSQVLRLMMTLLVLSAGVFAESFARAAPAGSAPPGGGAGTMGTGGGVDEKSGAPRASFPFELPLARGHAQPALALSYGSPQTIREAGYGWGFSIPSIERTGIAGPPQLDTEDRFSFGGSPLIPIGEVTSGACPVAGCTETMPSWALGAWYFRVQHEGGFLRFFRLAGDQTWKVQAPSGLTMEYGVPITAASAFAPADTGAVDVQSGTNVRWNLVRVYDASAGTPVNVVIYGWRHRPTATNELTVRGVLTDIFDTPEIGNPDDIDGYAHHTRIRYTPHEFPFRHHAPAWRAMPAFRAVGVDVSVRGSGPTREMLRRYDLRYVGNGHVAGRSHLARIRQEGRCSEPVLETVTQEHETYTAELPPSSCPTLPAVTFAYTPEVPATPRAFRQISINPPAAGDPEVTSPLSGSIAFEDVNGDGLMDIVETRAGAPLDKILYITERHFLSTSVRPTPLAFHPGASPPDSFLDTNTGLSAPGMWKTGTRGDVLWRPTDPPVGGTAPHFLVHVDGHQSGHWTYVRDANMAGDYRRPHLLGDLDGDGLVDAFHEENELCFSHRNFPSRTISTFAYPGSVYCITSDPIHPQVGTPNAPLLASLADFNGDGVLDYVVSRPLSVGDPPVMAAQPLQYYPGRGNRFNCLSSDGSCTRFPSSCNPNDNSCHSYILLKSINNLNLSFNPYSDDALILFGDVTGDGFADMIEVRDQEEKTVVTLQRNLDGQHFSTDPVVELPHGSGMPAPRATLGDVDGSGVASLVLAFQDGTIAFYDWHREELHYAPRPGLLQSMSNEYGATTLFEYTTVADAEASLNDDPWHPWAADGPWGRHAPSSFPIVSKVTVSNSVPAPAGITTTTKFDYREAVYDNWQNRFLGFHKTRVTQVGDATHPSLATDTTYWFERCPGRDGSLFCPETTEGFQYSPILGAPILIEQLDPDSGTPFSTTHLTYRNESSLLVGADLDEYGTRTRRRPTPGSTTPPLRRPVQPPS